MGEVTNLACSDGEIHYPSKCPYIFGYYYKKDISFSSDTLWEGFKTPNCNAQTHFNEPQGK